MYIRSLRIHGFSSRTYEIAYLMEEGIGEKRE
jgi:hypothetical protein